VLDALRRDAIEPHGAPPGATPALAELARRGTALPYAYATSSWTLPSHASMFAGRLPRQLALGQAPDGSPQGARPVVEALAERLLPAVLQAAGYETRAFSANLWVSPHVGFDTGFDRFLYAVPQRGGRIESMLSDGLRASVAWGVEGLRARADNGAAEMGAALRAAIDEWSGRPTFWFANLCECHSPCLPPRPWNDLPATRRMRAAADARRYLSFEALCLYAAGYSRVPTDVLERMRHLYGRAAAYMDRWIADVLGALDRRGILDDTLVIVTADHGENFGEQGLVGHGFAVNEALIHVPLVAAGPGAPVRDGAFSLASLPRTVAEAAGIERHPWPADELCAGLAVSQFDSIGPPDHPRVIEFAQRWGLDGEAVGRMTASYTAVTDGRRKLVRRDLEEPLLYDLEHDPEECSPLDSRQADGRFAELRAALEHPSIESATVGATGCSPPSPEELETLQQQMRLLGYM
jgi:arylsulfatase A-like enzyme